MEQITLELPISLAEKFKTLSGSDKNVLRSLVMNFLSSSNTEEKKKLKAKVKLLETMNDIGNKATQRGMTDDILENLLNED
jgi:hypothetical protein